MHETGLPNYITDSYTSIYIRVDNYALCVINVEKLLLLYGYLCYMYPNNNFCIDCKLELLIKLCCFKKSGALEGNFAKFSS